MKTVESKNPDLELVESLAFNMGIDARQFVQETQILGDLQQFEADRKRRDQKILDTFQGMGYEQELEMTMKKAKIDRIQMALLFYSTKKMQLNEQDNGLAA